MKYEKNSMKYIAPKCKSYQNYLIEVKNVLIFSVYIFTQKVLKVIRFYLYLT